MTPSADDSKTALTDAKPPALPPKLPAHSSQLFVVLCTLLVVNCLTYVVIALLSRRFVDDVPGPDRPVLTALGMFANAFACFFLSLWISLQLPQGRRLTVVVWIGAVLYRVILIPSVPIQEIDIYRYLWDGQVAARGVNPFRFSPGQVLSAAETWPPDSAQDKELSELASLVQHNDDLWVILSRISFEELPSIYPPVSQAVFAVATVTGPQLSQPDQTAEPRIEMPVSADARKRVHRRVVHMKIVLALFDLGTLALVIYLLRLTGRHVGWSVVYGWCPLVLKEIANSGHLDSIAIFLATAAVAVAVRSLRRAGSDVQQRQPDVPWISIAASAVLLAAAVGAKLYPVALAPLLAVTVVRRFGWWPAVAAAVIFVGLCSVFLYPMLPTVGDFQAPNERSLPTTAVSMDGTIELPPPPERTEPWPESGAGQDIASPPEQAATALPQDPSKGLLTFLNRWEMNDLIFMVIYENLRDESADTLATARPWFAVFPAVWTQPLVDAFGTQFKISKPKNAAFRLTRYITLVAWLIIAGVLSWRAAGRQGEGHLSAWLNAGFLSLAWFWLLAPTQNPWYWCWAIPLLPFAGCRTWLALAPLTMLYYLRFWFGYHLSGQAVWPTPYVGENFFHFVVVWVEFAPWFVVLGAESIWRWKNGRSASIGREIVERT